MNGEIWNELYFGNMEIRLRVTQKMEHGYLKSIIEKKRLSALELRKKRQLARIERERCIDVVRRLAQGLVLEMVDRSVEQVENMEDLEMVEIVEQEEVLLAMRNLWIVEDMEVVSNEIEEGGFDQEMLDLTTDSGGQNIQRDQYHRCDMD